MTQEINQPLPLHYNGILEATISAGFTMPSEIMTCCLLRTLAASKRGGIFLELGTGTGLATSWILDGMDDASTLITIDNDNLLLNIAGNFLREDKRLQIIPSDGGEWIEKNKTSKFDFIFADTWHGKYLKLEETLNMVKSGGFYIIDDMIEQSNWPEGHAQKATDLISYLDRRADFNITKQAWASGLIIAVKR